MKDLVRSEIKESIRSENKELIRSEIKELVRSEVQEVIRSQVKELSGEGKQMIESKIASATNEIKNEVTQNSKKLKKLSLEQDKTDIEIENLKKNIASIESECVILKEEIQELRVLEQTSNTNANNTKSSENSNTESDEKNSTNSGENNNTKSGENNNTKGGEKNKTKSGENNKMKSGENHTKSGENNTKSSDTKIVLYGLNENFYETGVELHSRIINIFQNYAGINLNGYVDEIYRIGKQGKQGQRRPVVIELLTKRTQQYVMQHCKLFKNTGMCITKFQDKETVPEN
ncbi:putative uncharacterized protein DDB_G0286901 [Spodoptera frugiperda]|uniref:Uncharacterized protein n=1 Tax=Spodoptera frugiperda TaxID=7108 RepID=A0A9R0ED27_SPOFR|nr:putative uncharacterized protein DDB_G0286901 [Spodoptera frugiperda]